MDVHDSLVDWDATDINPWSYLQDCLGVRGLPTPRGLTLGEIMPAIDALRMVLPDLAQRWDWVRQEQLTDTGEAFLRRAARHFRALSGWVLIELHDFWSEERVLATLPVKELPLLQGLAIEAETYGEGLEVLDN